MSQWARNIFDLSEKKLNKNVFNRRKKRWKKRDEEPQRKEDEHEDVNRSTQTQFTTFPDRMSDTRIYKYRSVDAGGLGHLNYDALF